MPRSIHPPTEAEVKRALRKASALPPGDLQVAAANEAVELARLCSENGGDQNLLVQAHINLLSASELASPNETELSLLTGLLWRLDMPTGTPITARQRFEILWMCRFGLARTRRSSNVQLTNLRQVYADVERRYRKEGVSPQLFAKYRAELARDLESDEQFRKWLEVWRTSPRDELSDCEVCDLVFEAEVQAQDGAYLKALELIAPVLDGEAECSQQPVGIYGKAAAWGLEVGFADLSAEWHRKGWPLLAERAQFAPAMVDHIVYLAKAGRVGRAWRLLADLVPFIDAPKLDHMDLMEVTGRIANVGRLATTLTQPPTSLAGKPWAEKLAEFEQLSQKISAAFTARNQSTLVADRFAKQNQLEVTTVPEQLTATEILELASIGAWPKREIPLVGTVADYAVQLEQASDALQAPAVTAILESWLAHRSSFAKTSDLETNRQIAYLNRRALSSAAARLDPDLTAQLLKDAASAAADAADTVQKHHIEIEILYQEAMAGRTHAWAEADGLVDALEGAGYTTEAGSALISLSRDPNPQAGVNRALRAAEIFGQAGKIGWQATALQAAGFAASNSHPGLAKTYFEQAAALAAAAQLPQLGLSIKAAQGRLAWLQSGPEAGLVHLQQAAAEAKATQAEAATLGQLGLGAEICEALLELRRWDDLVVQAKQLAQLAGQDPKQLAQANRFLGIVAENRGELEVAIELLEPAVRVLGKFADPAFASGSWALGHCYSKLHRDDLAGRHFQAAGRAFVGLRRPPQALAAFEYAANSYQHYRDLAQAIHCFAEAETLAADLGLRERLVAAGRKRAQALAEHDEVEAALSELMLLPGRAARVAPGNDQHLQAVLEYQAGQILQTADRFGEAKQKYAAAHSLMLDQGLDELAGQIATTIQSLEKLSEM